MRQDTGALWENFLITERMKRNVYGGFFCNSFFWRTVTQQEIDYVKEFGGKLYAYEFKWREGKTPRFPRSFLEAYPGSETMLVDQGNFEGFVGVGG